MRLRATIHPENAKYRTVDIGDARFSVFIGDERFVMDKLPSEHDEPWNVINMAGGQVSVWARVSQQVDRRTQSHFTISFKDRKLVEILKEIEQHTDGVSIVQSDLDRFGAFTTLEFRRPVPLGAVLPAVNV